MAKPDLSPIAFHEPAGRELVWHTDLLRAASTWPDALPFFEELQFLRHSSK